MGASVTNVLKLFFDFRLAHRATVTKDRQRMGNTRETAENTSVASLHPSTSQKLHCHTLFLMIVFFYHDINTPLNLDILGIY
jgi:hypothetical protein